MSVSSVDRRGVRLAAPILVFLASTLGACRSTVHRTDGHWNVTVEEPRVVLDRPGVVEQIVYYLPNRIVDAFDMINVSFGVGIGIPLDIRLTRWCQLALSPGTGIGWTWDGRADSDRFYTAGVTWAFGPWRGGVGTGRVSNVGDWEVGIGGGSGGKFVIDLAEVADFVLGWFFIDILEDDYGWVEAPRGAKFR
ncbi:MAG: hypothetical protein H6825_15380 [Planctomycetes bacterium]|nr:hypothetical protein [Planctomycetota bacterium]